MDTSYPRKLADLVAAFATAPRNIGPWFRHLPLWGRLPVDVELPWLSFDAIRVLEAKVRPHHRVFEFGSGGSSFFLARRAAHVTAVESDPHWHERVQMLTRERRFTNLDCTLHPLSGGNAAFYPTHPFFEAVRRTHWDVVVVDCFCGHGVGSRYGALRPHAFALALPQVAPDGLLVLDDSWMFPELLAPRKGWKIRNFVGPGPCRYGVTSTAILERSD